MTINKDPHLLKIRIPSSLGYIMGMTDIVSKLWSFATNITLFSQNLNSLYYQLIFNLLYIILILMSICFFLRHL